MIYALFCKNGFSLKCKSGGGGGWEHAMGCLHPKMHINTRGAPKNPYLSTLRLLILTMCMSTLGAPQCNDTASILKLCVYIYSTVSGPYCGPV